ncbi:hypothetical protein NE237_030921 [Protea cynaroides]|uniref:Uncharacterized protein n=1 Tax=Protea cynaroides TaxID=273540 RepID=A0A9Q0GV15_9MAGN|nr:hypothetical protein NE237_030921 [Protea cynaroides]
MGRVMGQPRIVENASPPSSCGAVSPHDSGRVAEVTFEDVVVVDDLLHDSEGGFSIVENRKIKRVTIDGGNGRGIVTITSHDGVAKGVFGDISEAGDLLLNHKGESSLVEKLQVKRSNGKGKKVVHSPKVTHKETLHRKGT